MSTQQISFAIQGMRSTWPKCTGEIERALTQLDGVVAARVNYATERATVVYDPARVAAGKMVNAIRRIAYDTPLERRTLHSDDLLYATSGRTVEKVIGKAEGVAQVSVDLAARSVAVELLPEHVGLVRPERLFKELGFRDRDLGAADAYTLFMVRTAVLLVVEFLSVWSAGAHWVWLGSASWVDAPVFMMVISLVALVQAGWPFYRSVYFTTRRGQFDLSVLAALSALLVAPGSLALRLAGSPPWFTDGGLVIAATLTTGWFVTRAVTLWGPARLERHAREGKDVSAVPGSLGVVPDASRR